MAFDAILLKFMDFSPATVMTQALMERVLNQEQLNRCFELVADKQYTRDLLFSSVFELMSYVVLKTHSSVRQVYLSKKIDFTVSITSVYNKLSNLEPHIPAALVRDTTLELSSLVHELENPRQNPLPGYRIKILDGNCLASTQHRLEVLRYTKAGPMPGKSLVVYDPVLDMAVDVFPCEDAYVQERALLDQVRATAQSNDVFVMDRNFCVRSHFIELIKKEAYFICRHHQKMALQPVGESIKIGITDTGDVYEQAVEIYGNDQATYCLRAITVKLNKKTRGDEDELIILTNLSADVADAIKIAGLYRGRWKIETVFQELEAHFRSEIDTLGYPKAALFGFCVALIAYNILAVIKAAMSKVHGEEKVENEVSSYHLTEEISRTHHSLGVIDKQAWSGFESMSCAAFVAILIELAQKMDLSKYKKSKRGPKKPLPPRSSSKNEPHVSTARRLLHRDGAP
jgi:hypothetical protein